MLNKDPTAAGVCEKFIFFERIMWVTKAGCFIKSVGKERERERSLGKVHIHFVVSPTFTGQFYSYFCIFFSFFVYDPKLNLGFGRKTLFILLSIGGLYNKF